MNEVRGRKDNPHPLEYGTDICCILTSLKAYSNLSFFLMSVNLSPSKMSVKRKPRKTKV